MIAHIEMKAMEKFPIAKLSYDLKSELLENMDPRDVLELANVNKGLRSIMVREPWRIFGKHVDYVSIIVSSSRDPIFIKKFESWISMRGDDRISVGLSGLSSPKMELKTFLTLISKIHSVSKLLLSIEAAQVSVENFEKYFTILPLIHINTATLSIRTTEGNEQMLGFLSNFVETSLNHCKSIEISEYPKDPHLSFRYEAFSKIWTEIILITSFSWDKQIEDFEGLIDGIVTKGIPGSNPEAAILLYSFDFDHGSPKYANDSVIDLLSRTLGIRQVAHEDRGEVGEILEKLIVDKLIPKSGLVRANEVEKFLREGVYFTRSVDSNRKCIYVTEPLSRFFFAKYVTIG